MRLHHLAWIHGAHLGDALGKRIALEIAGAVWLGVVVLIFAVWLAAKFDAETSGCASLGRAGERCAPTAFGALPQVECQSAGRGGRSCLGSL